MTIKNLLSSSSGNSTIIENNTTRIMIDAGTSWKQMVGAYGSEFTLDALFITHEHSDHIKGAGVVGRKTGCPIYLPKESYELKVGLFDDCHIHFIEGGVPVTVGDFQVIPYNTRHDSAACVGYVVTELSTKKKFGLLTDTGMITKLIKVNLADCDALFIECDYDTETLEKFADYDEELKQRIQSVTGHLSNQQALSFLEELGIDSLQWILMGHLSKNTNSPELLRSQILSSFGKEKLAKFHISENPITLEIT